MFYFAKLMYKIRKHKKKIPCRLFYFALFSLIYALYNKQQSF